MTKAKTTKKALFASAMSLILCFAMLLGTTYAWFTDSVTSGRNMIQSGNLDMAVSYKPYGTENTEWTPVTENTVMFGKDALYEPGYTEAIWLKVENVGSLAFKYQLALNIFAEEIGVNQAGEEFKLSDYLDVYYANIADQAGMEAFNTSRDSLINNFSWGSAANSGKTTFANDIALIDGGVAFPADDEQMGAYSSSYVLVVVQMPTTVGNEANHNGVTIPSIEFGFTALATQLPYEEDSFGPDYDANAEYYDPNAVYPISTIQELRAAAAKGGKYILVNDLTMTDEDDTSAIDVLKDFNLNLNGYDLDLSKIGAAGNPAFNIAEGKKANVFGSDSEESIFNIGAAYDNYGDLTLSNLTLKAGSAGAYATRHYAGTATLQNVNIQSGGGAVGVGNGADVIFDSGKAYVDSASTSGRYLFYAVGEGSTITINGGDFSWDKNDNNKRAYVYAYDGGKVYINGGTFGPASTRTSGNSGFKYSDGIMAAPGDVIITGGTFGFDPTRWVADGYVAVKTGTTWTVEADAQ